MTASEVDDWVARTGYKGDLAQLYQRHNHHFYPQWLGGKASGPTIRMLGGEHLKVLEPALQRHMKQTFPELTQINKKGFQQLMDAGRTQAEITDALVDFYKGYYPDISESSIRQLLALGL